jgi:hypothetical protein
MEPVLFWCLIRVYIVISLNKIFKTSDINLSVSEERLIVNKSEYPNRLRNKNTGMSNCI